MTNNFGGRLVANRRIPRHSGIRLARRDMAHNHATDAFVAGLRADASLTIKKRGPKDAAQRTQNNDYEVMLKAGLLQTSLTYLKNYYILSKDDIQAWVETQNGEILSFVRNATATVATPGGTNIMGMKSMKFVLEEQKRSVDIELATTLFPEEYDHLWASVGARLTNASGGSAIPLTAMAYDVEQYHKSNILWVSIAGFETGAFKDFKLEIEFSGEQDNRGVPYCHMTKHKFELTCLQSSATEARAAIEAGGKDITLVIRTANDESIQYTNGAMILDSEFIYDDKQRVLKITGECEVPYNVSESAPNAIWWGAKSLEFGLVGYPTA